MAVLVERALPVMQFAPGVGETPRQAFGEQVGEQRLVLGVCQQPVFGVDAGQQVQADRGSVTGLVGLLLPVARHLQYRRAGQATMGDKGGLAEHRAAALGLHLE